MSLLSPRNGRLVVTVVGDTLEASMLEETLRETSSPFEPAEVEGTRMYTISELLGERKTVVGL